MNRNFSLTHLIEIFQENNCVDNIVVKLLSENDNSKNQVYFGSSYEALNLFHNLILVESTINNTIKSQLDFSWVLNDGSVTNAPHSQLILYPQYPEVRFSGFLRSCRNAPSALMKKRQVGRLLVLGISSFGKILGYVTDPNTTLANEIRDSIVSSEDQVFHQIQNVKIANRANLLKTLTKIHLKGWISGWRLRADRSRVDCFNPNCGGYTLEAELNIIPNSISEPDYLGWEVKQYNVRDLNRIDSGGAITLMTPEPDGGMYYLKGVDYFIRTYGYPASGNPDRMNFGGVHKYDKKHQRTGLKLIFNGYEKSNRRIIKTDGYIALIDENDFNVASWSFLKLMEHWNKKHNKAVYIPSKSRIIKETKNRQYYYGGHIRLCENTDFIHFLDAVVDSEIYYDPGIKMTGILSKKTKTKRRSQFRIHIRNVPDLYLKSEELFLTS